jgi:hypothetical protein
VLHLVVEGEPGIFPQPVADVLRRLGGWAERLTTRRRRGDEPPPEEPEEPS